MRIFHTRRNERLINTGLPPLVITHSSFNAVLVSVAGGGVNPVG